MSETKNLNQPDILKVTVSGGGPVGLSFALLLESLMGKNVAITIYDGRWSHHDSTVIWKNEEHGNARRLQVVTLQSRQYLKYPQYIQDKIFQEEDYSEMWPKGPDSIRGYGPRNVRIAHIENQLLEIANGKTETIQLIPERFKIAEKQDDLTDQHVLAICEGVTSRNREHFIDKFGDASETMYSLGGKHLQDVVLGLRVQSELPDSMAVLLTVAQNRFLLNSLRGNGFLNMRLTDTEVQEVVGLDLNNREFKDCIQSRPCLMECTDTPGEFKCSLHSTIFLPALLRTSPLWRRIQQGLKMFGVPEENLTAVTAFRLDMVQRPRFTAQLYPNTSERVGTFGCLLGDAANAIHFWPGRGLNSGIASAVSLARCLAQNWRGRPMREADFVRHEGLMSMLQYRHKSRAWQAMIGTESDGTSYAIQDKIKEGIIQGQTGQLHSKESDIETLMERLIEIRGRLEARLTDLPDDDILQKHLEGLDAQTLRTLVVSKPWETGIVGGEEVDVDLFFEERPPASNEEAQEPSALPADETSIVASLTYEPEGQNASKLEVDFTIFNTTKTLKIGRSSAWSDLALKNPSVSRHHAIITLDEMQNLSIEDQKSGGGTHVNGQKLQPHVKTPLQHGDKVNFGGKVIYRVEMSPKIS